MISGRVWKFGDNINTDYMMPGPALYLPEEERVRYVFQANRPGWVDLVKPGDFIIGGTNYGVGSSRPAALSLRNLKIGCLIAESINGLFFRNCVNFGLVALQCPGIHAAFEEGKRPKSRPTTSPSAIGKPASCCAPSRCRSNWST
jgi:3-isopropylmalate/(R)-2-methylmalate dehydratase small subunit